MIVRVAVGVLGLVAAVLALVVPLALFERFVPRRVLRWYQKHVGAPLFRATAGLVPGWAVVETVGRRTGRPHRVPVGGRVIEGSFWFLASTGRDCDYVRNLESNPKVRVRVHGRWCDGVAEVRMDEDPRRWLFRLNPVNGLFLWLTGFELLPIRVRLASAE